MPAGRTIIFDLAATQPLKGQVHGAGEYAKAVFRELCRSPSEFTLLIFYQEQLPIDENLVEQARLRGAVVESVRDHQDVQRLIHENPGALFYSALPYHYHDLDFSGNDVVFTIHGLRSIEVPVDSTEWRYTSDWSGMAKWGLKSAFKNRYVGWRVRQFGKLLRVRARNVDLVVPSQHTKHALLCNFPDFLAKKIHVLYSPETTVSRSASPDTTIRQEYSLDDREFVLMVSGGRWVKNTYRGLLALEALIDHGMIDKKIVVAGGAPARLPTRLRARYTFLPYISDDQLAALYASAHCLLYPTLNEGFGYPPLEAMRYGTPVVCSAITSTTEILGDVPLYFSPYSQEEIANRILRIVLDGALWRQKSEAAKLHYADVSRQQAQALQDLCELLIS